MPPRIIFALVIALAFAGVVRAQEDTTEPAIVPVAVHAAQVSGTTNVLVSWGHPVTSTDVSYFIVLRDGVQVATTAGTTYLDEQLTSDETLVYGVKAVFTDGTTSETGTASAVTVRSADAFHVSAPSFQSVTGDAVSLLWTTSEATTGTADITDEGGIIVQTVSDEVPSTLHRVDIVGLDPATSYSVTVTAERDDGIRVASDPLPFITSASTNSSTTNGTMVQTFADEKELPVATIIIVAAVLLVVSGGGALYLRRKGNT